MRKAGAVMIGLWNKKNLRLMLKSSEGYAVYNAVSVALKIGA